MLYIRSFALQIFFFFWISCCLLVLFSIKFYWRCRVGGYYLLSVDIQTQIPINQSLKDRKNNRTNTTYLQQKCRRPQYDRKTAEEKLIRTPRLGLLICRRSLVTVQASDGRAKCLRPVRHFKLAMRLAKTVPIKTPLLWGHSFRKSNQPSSITCPHVAHERASFAWQLTDSFITVTCEMFPAEAVKPAN